MLLDAGSALGRNCGPLLISKRADRRRTRSPPGHCASRFLGGTRRRTFCSAWRFRRRATRRELVFSAIEPALLDGRFDAGVIIHENRFTYEAKGLKKIVDLGEFWEGETGAPIPLGGIVVRRSLPDEVKQRVNRVLRRSVEYAFAHRDREPADYVRAHAQEMSEDVMYRHIDLYVNEYSVDLGAEGRRAVRAAVRKSRGDRNHPGRKRLALPHITKPRQLFITSRQLHCRPIV